MDDIGGTLPPITSDNGADDGGKALGDRWRAFKASTYVRNVVKGFLWYIVICSLFIGGVGGTFLAIGIWFVEHHSFGLYMGQNGILYEPGFMALTTALTLLLTSIAGLLSLKLKFVKNVVKTEHDGKMFSLPSWKQILVAVLSAIVFFGLLQIAGIVLNMLGVPLQSSDTSQQISALLTAGDNGVQDIINKIVIALSVCVFAPFTEEIVFRGVIGRCIIDSSVFKDENGNRSWWRTLLACLLSGLLFGLAHLQPSAVITLMFFGALLTWLSSVKYKNVTISFIVHALYNTIGLALLFL